MPDVSFTGLLIVAAVAFGAPFVLGLFPRLVLPAVVLEIVAGIAIGPSGLDWVDPTELPIAILSVVGLSFLLFLAGLEIDFERLRGRVLEIAGLGFAVSLALAVAIGLALEAGDFVASPLLIAIILSSTSLGVIVPALKDAGHSGSQFGQLVIGACSIADFGAIILLTLFFSGEDTGTGAKLVLLGAFAVLVLASIYAIRGAEHSRRISGVLRRLQDTTAQIRVRAAFVLLLAFVALAEQLGLEVILGAFAAGAILTLVDRDDQMTHPQFRTKLTAIGFGVFIPVFFVSSGLKFDLDALTSSVSTLLRVPLFLAALLAVRGLPALLYRGTVGGREVAAAGLLQATSLPFIVAATQIGMELGLITEANGAALIAAGLLSVLIFPLAALQILGRGRPSPEAAQPGERHGGMPVADTGATAM
ncbi:MAG TPA: cation:proton antiporter [Solirubrobacterales bacterium]|nr:cation:proton antiporter [Solirubrobacterales bacterium]